MLSLREKHRAIDDNDSYDHDRDTVQCEHHDDDDDDDDDDHDVMMS